jgi:Rrf2 family protein
MVHLSRQPSDALTLISDVAKAQGVSESFLAKIFQKLARAGLVDSQRGVGGGVALAHPVNEISIRDIVEAVEGPVKLNRCGTCENAPDCLLVSVWREAQEKMLEVLADTTLDRLSLGDDRDKPQG